jgi:hypothetical protein
VQGRVRETDKGVERESESKIVRGWGRCKRGSTNIEKEMISRSTCTFQEHVSASRKCARS